MNLYESGGVPTLPPSQQDGLRKCPRCGGLFVGALLGNHVCATMQYVVDYWYDRHTRSWVVQCVDSQGNQVGEARYVYTKLEAQQFTVADFHQ